MESRSTYKQLKVRVFHLHKLGFKKEETVNTSKYNGKKYF